MEETSIAVALSGPGHWAPDPAAPGCATTIAPASEFRFMSLGLPRPIRRALNALIQKRAGGQASSARLNSCRGRTPSAGPEVSDLVARFIAVALATAPSAQTAVTPRAVAVIAADPSARRRARAGLALDASLSVVEAESIEVASDLLSGLRHRQVDVIVVHKTGRASRIIDEFTRARSAFSSLPIIGVWPDDERREDRRALKAGINGLLDENLIESALAPTARAVCSGLVCLPRRRPLTLQPELSPREKQVLGMLIMGFTNAEIGQRLYLAESTVKSHLSSAYVKLGVRSRKDAAAKILDPDEGLGTGILTISAS